MNISSYLQPFQRIVTYYNIFWHSLILTTTFQYLTFLFILFLDILENMWSEDRAEEHMPHEFFRIKNRLPDDGDSVEHLSANSSQNCHTNVYQKVSTKVSTNSGTGMSANKKCNANVSSETRVTAQPTTTTITSARLVNNSNRNNNGSSSRRSRCTVADIFNPASAKTLDTADARLGYPCDSRLVRPVGTSLQGHRYGAMAGTESIAQTDTRADTRIFNQTRPQTRNQPTVTKVSKPGIKSAVQKAPKLSLDSILGKGKK